MMSKADGGAAKNVIPLNSIRVFVEAARLLSFSRAALALGMTQSGVSHHVSSLEGYLGQALFVRSGSSVNLTDAGRLYFDTVQEAVSTIELSTRQFKQRPEGSGRLVVRTSLYTFAMTVLIPALPRFCPVPQISVEVVTSLSPPRMGDVFDVLISRDLVIDDDGHWLLATEELVCVGAPSVVREFAGKPMAAWPFLTTRSRPDVLSAWVNRQKAAVHDIHAVAIFEHYFLALPAAVGGMGFLVIPRLLASEPLQQGHLVEAVSSSVRSAVSYKAYINPLSLAPEVAKAFCRWLKGQLRKDEHGPGEARPT
jgi:LysR family glycine cleavage system transcriptional activator